MCNWKKKKKMKRQIRRKKSRRKGQKYDIVKEYMGISVNSFSTISENPIFKF